MAPHQSSLKRWLRVKRWICISPASVMTWYQFSLSDGLWHQVSLNNGSTSIQSALSDVFWHQFSLNNGSTSIQSALSDVFWHQFSLRKKRAPRQSSSRDCSTSIQLQRRLGINPGFFFRLIVTDSSDDIFYWVSLPGMRGKWAIFCVCVDFVSWTPCVSLAAWLCVLSPCGWTRRDPGGLALCVISVWLDTAGPWRSGSVCYLRVAGHGGTLVLILLPAGATSTCWLALDSTTTCVTDQRHQNSVSFHCT